MRKKLFPKNLKSDVNETSCDLCDEKFETILKLRVHVRMVHTRVSSSQTEETSFETKQVQTNFSEFTYEKKIQTLDDSLFEKNQPEMNPNSSKFKFDVHSCNNCRRSFTSKSDLEDHKIICRENRTNSQISPLQNIIAMNFPVGFPSSLSSPYWLPLSNPR